MTCEDIAVNVDMVQAEHIREQAERIRTLEMELIAERIDKRRIRRERDSAIGQLRLKCVEQEYEVS